MGTAASRGLTRRRAAAALALAAAAGASGRTAWAADAAAAASSPFPIASAASAASADAAAWSRLGDGVTVLIRHAEAPGVGDPPNFRLGDCATQRNLDDAGRAQARRIGRAFAERGVRPGAVRASQWCRTTETARLAFPGIAAQPTPAFNSFFAGQGDAAAQTDAAQRLIRAWRGPGAMVVVTHQVNITGLTGVAPASGEMVAVRPRDDGTLEVVARLRP